MKKDGAPTNQFPRHTSVESIYHDAVVTIEFSPLLVTYHKKKKSRWPSRYYYYHHQKKPSGLVYMAAWIFPVAAFPLRTY